MFFLKNYNKVRAIDPKMWGFSFSHRQCDWLGLEAKSALESLCATGQFKYVRFSVYWDEESLDNISWQLETARKFNISAIVSVGLKAQRYPEFYPAAGAKEIQKELLKHLESTLLKLRSYTNVYAWQVENEPLDPSGPQGLTVPEELLAEEVLLVNKLKRAGQKISLNVWGNDLRSRDTLSKIQQLDFFPLIDEVGLDIYPRQFAGRFRGPDLTPGKMLNKLEKIHESGKLVNIYELQAEPWENLDYRKMQDQSKLLSSNLEFLKNTISKYTPVADSFILLWGAEYWLWAGILEQVTEILSAGRLPILPGNG